MTVSRFCCRMALPILCLFSMPQALRAQDAAMHSDRSRVEVLAIPVPELAPDGLRVRVLLPDGYDPKSQIGYPVLYLNDGQDAEAVALQATLKALIHDGVIRPLIAVAIDMPRDRMGAYGYSDRAHKRSLVAPLRVGAIGAHAHAYSEWVATRLVPAIDAKYRTRAHADARAVLGWSLGAANALNLGWQYPEVFAVVGAFSPSLWLSPKPDEVAGIQASRFAQSMIAAGAYHPGSRFFFAVGDTEETDDRDGDGVIDVLDDARDLIDGWRMAGDAQPRAKGLRQLGHSVNLDHAATAMREVQIAFASGEVQINSGVSCLRHVWSGQSSPSRISVAEKYGSCLRHLSTCVC